ncbi:hypothetical protein KSS87_000369 [Heliosperma pusillum]|nr:hypothetical protein KSS87_000369 [Heliosperma pusillum]
MACSGRHLLDDGESKPSADITQGYMSNVELENVIIAFGERCSNISRIYSIGRSVGGLPLWVMEISDNPGREEPEPAFKFIGNVHGDEPVGRELLILLANWLCDNYVKDPLAKFIVENVHLHLLPSMNPDGFALRRRGNAKNIDLNRDFPDQFFSNNDVEDTRQPETKAIMRWLRRIQFTASASLHGGALVANYPWDGTQSKRRDYYACPDDETFRYLAGVYSHSHHNMSLSKEFPEGITNGAAWYPIYGGMQDWNYIHAGCLELTLEISDNKWPNASEGGNVAGSNQNVQDVQSQSVPQLLICETSLSSGFGTEGFSRRGWIPAAVWEDGCGGMVAVFPDVVYGGGSGSGEVVVWWPGGFMLPTIWEYNRMSMLNLVAAVAKTGVHGRIFSSDNGKPLPASIMVEGINQTMKARVGIADYHRLLAPKMKYEVKASMPGYKSKSTTIMLEEVTALDFILDPEADRVGKVLETVCDCTGTTKSNLEVVDILAHPQLEVSLVVLVTLAHRRSLVYDGGRRSSLLLRIGFMAADRGTAVVRKGRGCSAVCGWRHERLGEACRRREKGGGRWSGDWQGGNEMDDFFFLFVNLSGWM